MTISLSAAIATLASLAAMHFAIRGEVDKAVAARENEIVQHYLPRVNKVRQDLGMPPKTAKDIDGLIDASMEPATNLMQLPQGPNQRQ